MNHRVRSSKRSSDAFLRFLKPGALAKFINSRISARSHRTDSKIKISLCCTPPPASSPNRLMDGTPNFTGRIYGVRCPQRKKLVAAKALYFLNSNPSSLTSDSVDPITDVFSNDILLAH